MLERIKRLFSKSRFANSDSAARHASLIASGAAIGQIIAIVTVPIISRIYSPSDFGVMALYASLLAILQVVSGFQFHHAIPLPKDERYAKALVLLSLGLQALFVACLTIILLFSGNFILTKLSMIELIPYRMLIPLGLMATGIYSVLLQWAIRERLFSAVARTRVTQSISGELGKIILGLMGIRPLGLIVGSVISQAGGVTTLLRAVLKTKALPRATKGEIQRAAIRYRKFPLFGTWSSLLNSLGTRIIPILLVSFYNIRIAGLFAMAQALLLLPSSFIGQAIGQVFLQRASAARYTEGLHPLALRTYIFLLRLGFYPSLMIAFFSPYLFSFFLGEKWIEAGVYARLLGPMIAFVFVFSPMSLLYSIMNRQEVGLIVEALQITLVVLAFLLGTLTGNPLIAIGCMVNLRFVITVARTLDLLVASGASFRESFLVTIKVMAETFFLVLIPFLIIYLELGLVFSVTAVFASILFFIWRNYVFFLAALVQPNSNEII